VRELAVTAVGPDRPGIVAALSGALLGLAANLEDCRAALLRGSFAMAMVVAVPDGVDEAAVERALAPEATRLGLTLWIGPATPAGPAAAGERCVVSVYGADHPGIVHATSRMLAAHEVNIVDLSSRLVGDPPVYVLGMEVDLPAGLAPSVLEAALRPLAAEQRVEVALEVESDDVM
jgi:glycine cleavage system transcriptional repressor